MPMLLMDLVCSLDGCLLGSTEQLCTKLASDLTHAVVQATDMYSQVKNNIFRNFTCGSVVVGCRDILVPWFLFCSCCYSVCALTWLGVRKSIQPVKI